MQRPILTALYLALATLLNAQVGVAFNDNPTAWEPVLAEAKAQNKIIFVDGYTTWCGPCKMMDRKTFSDEMVGRLFNERFVNVKLDMEKGIGKTIADRYRVEAYPTFLFLNAEGEVLHRVAGYHDPNEFLGVARKALDPMYNIAAYERRFEQGDRDTSFLLEYLKMSYNAADGKHGPIAEAYLATQPDWNTPDNLQMVYTFGTDIESPLFKYVSDNRTLFYPIYGESEVDKHISETIYANIYYGDTKPTLDQVEGIYQRYFPDRAGVLYANYKMSYYRQLGDREGYAKAAVERFEKYDASLEELNDAALTFYRVVDDKKLLKKATKWAKKSVKEEGLYENYETLALLYHKRGKKRRARKYARKAIAIAEADGADSGTMQQLLDGKLE